MLGARTPSYDDLGRLRYAQHVVTEAMRLYPPAYAIGREATRACEIGGYPVPAGTTLLMSPWVMHRDPRYFDEPETFMPERWEDGLAEQLPRFAYYPFGGGPRLCLGHRFAMVEAVLVLSTIAARFRLARPNDRPVVPFPSMTLRPDGGLAMTLERRGLP